jgi:hypothetical protein
VEWLEDRTVLSPLLTVNNLALTGPNPATFTNSGTWDPSTEAQLVATSGTITTSGNMWNWSLTTSSTDPIQVAPVTIYAQDSQGNDLVAQNFWINVGHVFTVNNTGDNGGVDPTPGAGTGTLRQAIVDANYAGAGSGVRSLIEFGISGPSFTVQPTSELPSIQFPVIVDGFSQSGSIPNTMPVMGSNAGDNAFQNIVLDGGKMSGQGDGLDIAGGNSTVEGLDLQNFTNGIHLTTSGNDTIAGNYLTNNTNPSGSGILVDDVPNNTIGGTAPAARNVCADGAVIQGTGATGNVVEGNYLDTDGSKVLHTGAGQGGDALLIVGGASSNTVGGTAPGAGNVIGSSHRGIDILGSNDVPALTPPAIGNLVEGNYIGVNATGTAVLSGLPGARGFGIATGDDSGTIIGGTTPSARNVIAGWSYYEVVLGYFADNPDTGSVVEGNYIGTNAAGSAALVPNQPLLGPA